MEETDETDESRELDLLAADIKKRFIDCKFKSQQGFNTAVYEDGKSEKYFIDAARLCLKLEADPEIFVNCQFRRDIDGRKVHPQFLTSDVAKNNYESIMCQDMAPEAEYDVQIKYLRNQLYRAKRKVENILMDDDIAFTAWFRICISTSPIPCVIDKYKEKAKYELAYNAKKAEAKKQSESKLLKFLKEKNLDYTRITND